MIFLDTTYINGLIIKRVSFNDFSNSLKQFLQKESKATNITVLVEVLNSLKPYNFVGDVDEIINQFLRLEVFDFLTADDYKEAMELFKFYNFSINFADCTILVSMQKHGINKIATSDSHFDKIRGIQRISGIY